MTLYQPHPGWFSDSIGIACGVRYIERAWGLWPGQLAKPTVLLHGGCRGADLLVANIFRLDGCEVRAINADWTLGKKAGPIRNRRMVEEAIAMSGGFLRVRALALWDGVKVKTDGRGSGTYDCITACMDRNIEVAVLWQLPDSTDEWAQLAQDRLEEMVVAHVEYNQQDITRDAAKRLEGAVRREWAWTLGWKENPQ